MPRLEEKVKTSSRVLWNPTSREKRARYGAPEFAVGKMPEIEFSHLRITTPRLEEKVETSSRVL
jgi:hypothetical protein